MMYKSLKLTTFELSASNVCPGPPETSSYLQTRQDFSELNKIICINTERRKGYTKSPKRRLGSDLLSFV